jgi:hypothetical protein
MPETNEAFYYRTLIGTKGRRHKFPDRAVATKIHKEQEIIGHLWHYQSPETNPKGTKAMACHSDFSQARMVCLHSSCWQHETPKER